MIFDALDILNNLTESSNITINRLLEYLKNTFDVHDIVYYSSVVNDEAYVLRGQILSEENTKIEPVLYPCPHLRDCVKKNRLIRIKNARSTCKDSQNCPFKSLSNFNNSNSCIILPIPFNADLHAIFQNKKYCGVLFFNVKNDFKNVHNEDLNKLSKICGELYSKAILYDKLKLRDDIFKNSVKSPDINSFFHRTIELLTRNWDYEAISFFKNEAHSKLIKLRRTTGLEQDYKKTSDVFYHYNENHLTVEVAVSGKEKILINPESTYTCGKYSESVKKWKAACGIFPILLPPERRYETQQVFGVLRIINRLYRIQQKEIPTPFTWEDVLLLRFICEMSGMVCFLLEGSSERFMNLERMTHGMLNYITASSRSITQVIERSNYQNLVHESLKYNLSATLGNLEAIDWQISKYTTPPLTSKSKLIKKLFIYGDVLGEVVTSAYKVSKSLGVELKISNLGNAGFKNVSPIMGNATAIKLVFKNLFENAMKYRKSNECNITVTHSESNDNLYIFVSDDGIGIKDSEKEYIFYEGYRCEEAMATNPSGTGFGLFQCQEWLDAIGGKIEIVNTKNPTTFKLSFPKAKEDSHDLYS